ncbi:MAG: hypothetical protein RLZZ628_2789 [Bacteroidota bacterium]|jgi:gamma-glutamylcyclotransferase (GGCT)/AIG2-like uncharacterized protein YtfP
MEIDKMIEILNKKKHPLHSHALTKDETAFLETYQPEKSLIIYGSLAPNAPNHFVVEPIHGNWRQGIVRGHLEKIGWGADLGYNAFRHVRTELQTVIKAFILFSKDLVNHWERLDEFEGDGYRRIFAKYELNDGQIGVGSIYAINE